MRAINLMILAAIAVPSIASAQASRSRVPAVMYQAVPNGSYYTPRVTYQPARPLPGGAYYYESGGALVGAAAATFASGVNPYAGLGGGFLGGAVGHQTYYNSTQPTYSYYAPPAYGMQTTTPYMVIRGN